MDFSEHIYSQSFPKFLKQRVNNAKIEFAKHHIVMVPEISEKKKHSHKTDEQAKLLKTLVESCWKLNKQFMEQEPE